MEKSKAVSESENVYKDEFCFVTKSRAVYRKENARQAEKKLGEIEADEDVESTLVAYRGNFTSLEEELNELETLNDEELKAWKNKLQESEAIGDFEKLYSRLDELNDPEPDIAEDDTVDQSIVKKEDVAKTEEEHNQADEPANEDQADDTRNEETAEQGVTETEKPAKDPQEQENADKADTEEKQDDLVAYYKRLTKEAQDAAKSEDWSKATQQLNDLSHQWSDGPEVEDEDEEAQEKIKDLYYKFTKAEESFSKRKEEYYAKADKQRKENLTKKKELLSEIEKIVNAEEWSATGKINKLERKWHCVGQVPKEQASDIEEKYASLIKEFKSHKVDRLVEKRQAKEDNLMMKMAVLDKMEKVAADMDADTTDWEKVDDAFSDLTGQWKKIGRVPRERANQVWDRYKSAQDAYYDNKYKYHKDHRSNFDSFTAKKENVIEDAEALLEQKDIAKAARKVNKLHRRWKKIGNLPQRKEDDLWDRFKAATDAFNQRKADNQDKIEQQEEEHYQQKLKLIEKAEEVKDTTDWDNGHQQMQSMMDRWKKIGPVPRKKSGKIWKQFKGAMDVFYDRRREHFKEAKEEQKENLKKKEDLLEKLRELGRHPDPIEAVNEAKKLQEEFKNVGYVPIKRKNEMWQRYREVCDVIYDRMRAAKSGNKFDQELAKADLDPEQRSQIQDLRKEHSKVKNEVRSLKEEVLQLEESKSNFNFSDDDNPLLKDMQEKIQKAKARLESKQNKMDALSMEMEDIREEA